VPDAWTAEVWDQSGARLGLFTPALEHFQPLAARGIATSQVGFGFVCRAPACHAPVDGYAIAAVRHIDVTVRDDAAPALLIDQAPPETWQPRDSIEVAVRAGDNVGIAALELLLDDERLAGGTRGCYDAATNRSPTPCAGEAALHTTIDASRLADGKHELRVHTTDVAGNVADRSMRLLIDRHAPGLPQSARTIASEAWRSQNVFAAAWTNPPALDGGPIARSIFLICPASDEARDRSGCVHGERAGEDISTIDDLAVPGDGVWQLRLSVADAAGNVDDENMVTAGELRLDTRRPSAVLIPPDARDPTRLMVDARDLTSGVGHVEVEARRRGDATWHVLDVTREGDAFTAVADDDVLPAGTYDFRARAIDLAGNEVTTTTLSDGSPLTLRLPAREGSRMTAGARGRGSRFVSRLSPKFGQRLVLAGSLLDAAGKPRAGAPIEVLERVGDRSDSWQAVSKLHTSSRGTFVTRPTTGPARVLRFRYAGSATTRSVSADVELRVRAGVTLVASRSSVRNGASVKFRGRLLGGPLPSKGKLVLLQARTSRGWRTFATARAGARGKWAYRYRFTDTSTTARYAFRVVVPEEASYPYERGTSSIAYVHVHPY
jgi:hypothetical protein